MFDNFPHQKQKKNVFLNPKKLGFKKPSGLGFLYKTWVLSNPEEKGVIVELWRAVEVEGSRCAERHCPTPTL